MKKANFKKVSVSFITKAQDEETLINELQNLPYGIYHMGCLTEDLTSAEWEEVKNQVPDDILRKA